MDDCLTPFYLITFIHYYSARAGHTLLYLFNTEMVTCPGICVTLILNKAIALETAIKKLNERNRMVVIENQ